MSLPILSLNLFISGMFCYFLSFSHPALAEKVSPPPLPPPPSSSVDKDTTLESSPKLSRKGRVNHEKEAEGTEALNRFDADINIKSKYEYQGQPLEVDPD